MRVEANTDVREKNPLFLGKNITLIYYRKRANGYFLELHFFKVFITCPEIKGES